MVTNETDSLPVNAGQEVALPQSIRPETLKLLFEITVTSYKEQSDLDESVWRSMPFIAALFGLAITVIRFVTPNLNFSEDWIHFSVVFFYAISMAAFVLAFIYFWMVAKPRYFEMPAKSAEIRDHVAALTDWYVSMKTPEKSIDVRVTEDLRRMLVNQMSNAIEANRVILEKRLAARSRTILLLLAGFAFISISEMLTFSINEISRLGANNDVASTSKRDCSADHRAGTPRTAQGNSGAARC